MRKPVNDFWPQAQPQGDQPGGFAMGAMIVQKQSRGHCRKRILDRGLRLGSGLASPDDAGELRHHLGVGQHQKVTKRKFVTHNERSLV